MREQPAQLPGAPYANARGCRRRLLPRCYPEQENHASLRASIEADETKRRMERLDKGHVAEREVDARREKGEL